MKNWQDLEEVIKKMWEANVVNYPMNSTADQSYKYGWEAGCRFWNNICQSLLDQQRADLKKEVGEWMVDDRLECELDDVECRIEKARRRMRNSTIQDVIKLIRSRE
jgi:ketopantoate reductase